MASNAEMLALARSLPVPTPWNRDRFIDNLAAMRGRPITLLPTETSVLADSPCGLWLACDDEDLILHETGTSDYHIDQIVCHEIGHMLLGHGQNAAGAADQSKEWKACQQSLPDISPDVVRAILGRAQYSNTQEREAETFAIIMMRQITAAADGKSMLRSVFFPRP